MTNRLPPPPAVVLDVGGAAGRYSCWLASEGYEVHLIDPVAALIEQAEEASARQPDAPIASCRVGDARALEVADSMTDAVLMFGPLYHLPEARDRLVALGEAHRTLKAGGLLFAVGISRFASVMDGMARGFVRDPEFFEIVKKDLRDGRHENPTDNLDYFTDAFFHRPEQLRAEVEGAGFEGSELIAIDGPGAMIHNLDGLWQEKDARERLLELLRRVECEPALLGASAHLMCVARAGTPTP